MKYLYSFFAFLAFLGTANSQTNLTADPAGNWSGYMNWFNNDSGSKGDYAGGDNWTVADLKTTLTASGDSTYSDGAVTLQPNFSAYAANVGGTAADQQYWTDGAGGGNKFMEAISKIELAANTFTDGALSFAGTVASNTISTDYTVKAFIKTLNPGAGYAQVIFN
ncbi:MAG: hypothetical protein ACPH53_02125, partial [Flavobacteriaceae bacterium]